MKVYFILIVILLTSISLAGSEKDSVNIKEIVQNQIMAAQEILVRERELINSYKASAVTVKNAEPKIDVKIKQPEKPGNGLMIKLFILIAFSFVSFLTVYFVRKNKKRKSIFIQKLINNIKIIRHESPAISCNPSLTHIRTNLTSSIYNEKPELDITAPVKKFKIAKGELLLAAKIKDSLNKKENNHMLVNTEPAGEIEIMNKEILKKAKALKVSREEIMLASKLKKIKVDAAL